MDAMLNMDAGAKMCWFLKYGCFTHIFIAAAQEIIQCSFSFQFYNPKTWFLQPWLLPLWRCKTCHLSQYSFQCHTREYAPTCIHSSTCTITLHLSGWQSWCRHQRPVPYMWPITHHSVTSACFKNKLLFHVCMLIILTCKRGSGHLCC